MKLFYKYLSDLKNRIIARIENITKRENWLFNTMFYCSLISLFFAFPSFEKWDVSSGRLSSFLLQCEGITEFWNENKISNINYRLTVPILVGLSRKSMIYKSLKIKSIDALNGTSVLNTVALLKKANILRVHDVKEAKESIELCKKLV